VNGGRPGDAPVRLAAAVAVAVFLSVMVLGWSVRARVSDSLYGEKVRAAEDTLDMVAAGSVIPLASEDTLTLHSLVRGAAKGRGRLFVSVADGAGIVRADTDPARVGSPWKASGNGVVELSRPIVFRGKPVGTARIGLSAERLRAEAERDSFPLGWLPVAAVLCAVSAGGVAFAGARMSRKPGTASGHGGADPGTRNGAGDPGAEREGEPSETTRNPVTVLHVSVKEFRSYAASTIPDDLMRNLKEVFSIASRNVLGYGGHIEKYQGESLTGVFGTPSDLVDHTRRAVRAAVSIQKTVQSAAAHGNELLAKVSIGISTGVVLSGRVASGETSSPFYVGEIFEEAESLARAAREGEIVISRDVYLSVQSLVSVEPLPPHAAGEGRGSWEAFRLLRIEERKNRG